jgi:cbb3-type cytochrome c oxidase subunit III
MGRTTIKLAAALCVVATVGGVGGVASSRAAQAKRGAQVRSATIDVHTVYSRNCATCHGEDGDAKTEKGELYGATDFTDSKWWSKAHPTDAQLRRVITTGKRGGMPAFGKRLSAAEINALASYVRGFKGK